jgi:hypothetical protein
VESSNNNLMTIIKNIEGDNKRNWDSKTKSALWVDRITKKYFIRKIPFELVSWMEVILSFHLNIPSYNIL